MRKAFAITAAVLAVASPALATGSPKLHLVRAQPVIVRGTGFRAAERIAVRLAVEGAVHTRLVHASTSGRFTVSFPRVSLSHCIAYLVVARGSLGSHATLRRSPFADCAQP